jgi:tetratricopeptide (TPR) repeat protein
MLTPELLTPEQRQHQNQRAYDRLIVSIEASLGSLNLLIACCDDSGLRDRLIEDYEQELEPDIQRHRVQLNQQEPSLRAALAQVVTTQPQLQPGQRAVLTVLGAEQLYFLRLGEERSQQELFFGYLQWTREALSQFPYGVVLWVTKQLVVEISRHAPDFWSWRNGVFWFESHKTSVIPAAEWAELKKVLTPDQTFDDTSTFPLEDLQRLIADTEAKRGLDDPLLASLYDRAGRIHKQRLESGQFKDYPQEQQWAIAYFQKAIRLQEHRNQRANLATTLQHLAELYEMQSEFGQAEPLYQRVLDLNTDLYGATSGAVATSLDNLAGLYHTQGQFDRAEELYLKAMALRRDQDDQGAITTSLNNLANLHHARGDLAQAEELYQEALALRRQVFGDQGSEVATVLNNLALLFCEQGRYDNAEPLFGQALEIKQALLGNEHPDVATGQNNLGLVYARQGRYRLAEARFQAALELCKKLHGPTHTEVAGSLNNLAFVAKAQADYDTAKQRYGEALAIYEDRLGADHPLSQRCRDNLDRVS